eukprot:gnl/Spiro4/5535_TR2810_c0_g1_i2.p1 gnl/Spiro4/5535_TR2810_c0_g1~~gnl/Spiro4/5535_TR2810_c0_g1_i2.p1  ORF type:complete len:1074 (+),score=326.91 gnl/Spiro4/5535_TR2810_c0_g1_i2:139-3222(+)
MDEGVTADTSHLGATGVTTFNKKTDLESNEPKAASEPRVLASTTPWRRQRMLRVFGQIHQTSYISTYSVVDLTSTEQLVMRVAKSPLNDFKTELVNYLAMCPHGCSNIAKIVGWVGWGPDGSDPYRTRIFAEDWAGFVQQYNRDIAYLPLGQASVTGPTGLPTLVPALTYFRRVGAEGFDSGLVSVLDSTVIALIMEPCNNLDDGIAWLRANLSAQQRIVVVRDFLNGLKQLHDAGVVHRDITPAHLLVCGNPSVGSVGKIGSMGSAGRISGSTSDSQPASNSLYKPPEYYLHKDNPGAATPELDLFALGLAIYPLIRVESAAVVAPYVQTMQTARKKMLFGDEDFTSVEFRSAAAGALTTSVNEIINSKYARLTGLPEADAERAQLRTDIALLRTVTVLTRARPKDRVGVSGAILAIERELLYSSMKETMFSFPLSKDLIMGYLDASATRHELNKLDFARLVYLGSGWGRIEQLYVLEQQLPATVTASGREATLADVMLYLKTKNHFRALGDEVSSTKIKQSNSKELLCGPSRRMQSQNILLDSLVLRMFEQRKDCRTAEAVSDLATHRYYVPLGWMGGITMFSTAAIQNKIENLAIFVATVMAKKSGYEPFGQLGDDQALNGLLQLYVENRVRALNVETLIMKALRLVTINYIVSPLPATTDVVAPVGGYSSSGAFEAVANAIFSNVAPTVPSPDQFFAGFDAVASCGTPRDRMMRTVREFAKFNSLATLAHRAHTLDSKLFTGSGALDRGTTYFAIPFEKKSYSLMLYIYFMMHFDTNTDLIVPQGLAATVPRGATVVVVDDVSNSGSSFKEAKTAILKQNRHVTTLMTSIYMTKPAREFCATNGITYVAAVEVGDPPAAQDWMGGGGFKLSGQPESLMMTVLPYMSPDNNGGWFQWFMAPLFLLGGRGVKIAGIPVAIPQCASADHLVMHDFSCCYVHDKAFTETPFFSLVNDLRNKWRHTSGMRDALTSCLAASTSYKFSYAFDCTAIAPHILSGGPIEWLIKRRCMPHGGCMPSWTYSHPS